MFYEPKNVFSGSLNSFSFEFGRTFLPIFQAWIFGEKGERGAVYLTGMPLKNAGDYSLRSCTSI